MGVINVIAQDEYGTAKGPLLSCGTGVLFNSLSAESTFIRTIDPYGDTYFNQLQIPIVIAELQALAERLHDPKDKATIREIIGLAKLCMREPGYYLKFIGD